MGDLDSDGRAALLDTVADAGQRERQIARRACARYALQAAAPHQALAELLDQLGLRLAEDEPR